MTEDIRKILEAAILAPSGENSQPWRFIVKNDEVILQNDPDSDRKKKGGRTFYSSCREPIGRKAPRLETKAFRSRNDD